MKCEISGIECSRHLWGIHIHHKIKSQHVKKYGEQWFKDRGIKQRLIPLFYEVHSIVHKSANDREFRRQLKKFAEEKGLKINVDSLKLSDYLWNRRNDGNRV